MSLQLLRQAATTGSSFSRRSTSTLFPRRSSRQPPNLIGSLSSFSFSLSLSKPSKPIITTWTRRTLQPQLQQQPQPQRWFSSSIPDDNTNTAKEPIVIGTMEPSRLYQYLQLQTFTPSELSFVFDKICNSGTTHNPSDYDKDNNQDEDNHHNQKMINEQNLTAFLLERIHQIEKDINHVQSFSTDTTSNDNKFLEHQRFLFAQEEALRILQLLDSSTTTTANNTITTTTISKDVFVSRTLDMAISIDIQKLWPISLSILLVGTSVGIITPAMPFVVENIGLTPGQYGTVVSAFALAKMAGNIPSAILVERHGRKPYLTFSLAVIALGVGGIGAATSFEQLYACRFITGAGVAALTTASQLMVTDISTPLNRATTQSPIISAFSAGAALGPALGGYLVDHIGLQSTFFAVGASYLGVAVLNRVLLEESKRKQFYLPEDWNQYKQHEERHGRRETKRTKAKKIDDDDESNESLVVQAKDALAQWVPLFQNPKIRSIMIMNSFYWFALAGSQMTLLPLILTNPSGLNMTASGVGQVYMLMSLVQVMSNPIMARYLVDRIGKVPAIAGGCAVIASSMTCLPLCTDNWPFFVATMGFWALGSSMLSTAPLAYISDLVDEGQRAQAIAMLRTSGDIGFLFGASCIGGLADVTGSLEFAMQSSGGLLSAATFWFIVRQSLLSSTSSSSTALDNNSRLSNKDRKTH